MPTHKGFCQRDPSWQHELVSEALSNILAGDLRELAGEAPSDSLVACLQLKCKHPLRPCSYVHAEAQG